MKKLLKTTICAAALSICAAAHAATSVDLEADAIHLYKFNGDLSNSATSASKSDLTVWAAGGSATASNYESVNGSETDKAYLFSAGKIDGTGGAWENKAYTAKASFSFLLQLKSGGEAGKALFAYGSNAAVWSTCIGIFSGGEGIIEIRHYYNQAVASSISLAVDGAEDSYHTYALVAAGNGTDITKTIYVYIDGRKRGTLTTNGYDDPATFAFGSTYIYNTATDTLNSTKGGVGDFRFFSSTLNEDDIAAYQTLMNGSVPSELLDDATHWYKFDGNLASSGAETLTFSGGTDGATYTTEKKRTSLNLSTTVKPYGSDMAYSDYSAAYTFICCGKMSASSGRPLWTIGPSDKNSMGVYSADGNTVNFCYGWGSNATTVKVTATVQSPSETIHTYAIVKSAHESGEATMTCYVDGVSVGTFSMWFDSNLGGTYYQFGSLYGTSGSYDADGAELDDWRMFSRELSAEEIRQYHERFREHTGFVIIISDATLEVPTTWGGVSGMTEDEAEVALVAENSYGVKGYEAYLLGYSDIESANRVMGAAVSGESVSLSFAGAGTPPTGTGVTVTYKAQYRESMTDGDWADYPADSEDEHYVATSTDGMVSMAFANAYAYTRLVAEYE